MKQITKKDGMYRIFDCESKVVTVMSSDWHRICIHMKAPDVYVIDASVDN